MRNELRTLLSCSSDALTTELLEANRVERHHYENEKMGFLPCVDAGAKAPSISSEVRFGRRAEMNEQKYKISIRLWE